VGGVIVDAIQFVFARYDGFQEYPEPLLKDLSEEQQRRSPHPGLNPLAWTLWHTARCEDVGINGLIGGGHQVHDLEPWTRRLRVNERCMGTGMTREEVAELCEAIDLTQLRSYRRAVVARTRQVVGGMSATTLAEKLTRERLEPVLVEGGDGGPAAAAIVEAYRGHTKGWLLGHLALTHNFYHIGQAFGVRALLGASSPW